MPNVLYAVFLSLAGLFLALHLSTVGGRSHSIMAIASAVCFGVSAILAFVPISV